jgi:hypothetical protein
VQNQSDVPSTDLTRRELLASQQLTAGSNWFLAIYGFDLKYKKPSKLKTYQKSNYLNTAYNILHFAGACLYNAPHTNNYFTSDKLRFRKVISRILVADFIINILNKKAASPSTLFDSLLAEAEKIDGIDSSHTSLLFHKVEALYLQKLKAILDLAEAQHKIDHLVAEPY